jgi:hypothetical protein
MEAARQRNPVRLCVKHVFTLAKAKATYWIVIFLGV